MKELEVVNWYQVDATGAIWGCGVSQVAHVGEIVPQAGMAVRLGAAIPLLHYETAPGVLAKYTPAEQALRSVPVLGKRWNARSKQWV